MAKGKKVVTKVSAEDLKKSAENMNPLRAVTEKSSDVSSDYANHPKFAKFSKKGAE